MKPPIETAANEALVEQIRANVAFEHVVVSVLAGAGVCGRLKFLLSVAFKIAGGIGPLSAVSASAFSALVVALLFFLIGFAAGAVIITPLFRYLEKAKRRSGGPYGAAALAVAAFTLIIIGAMPNTSGPSLSAALAVLVATLATSVIFARRMAPHWAAVEAEERANAGAPITFRLN